MLETKLEGRTSVMTFDGIFCKMREYNWSHKKTKCTFKRLFCRTLDIGLVITNISSCN